MNPGETGFYYLQSRYYDPNVGRFINADEASYLDPSDPISANIFAYCYNNPIVFSDSSGRWAYSKSTVKVDYSKKSRGIVNKYFTVTLTRWVSTKDNFQVTWTENASVSLGISLDIGVDKIFVASLGFSKTYTISAGDGYIANIDPKKGKWARLIMKIDAAKYEVYKNFHHRTDYYSYFLIFPYISKTTYDTYSMSIGYIYKPMNTNINHQYISVQYKN